MKFVTRHEGDIEDATPMDNGDTDGSILNLSTKEK